MILPRHYPILEPSKSFRISELPETGLSGKDEKFKALYDKRRGFFKRQNMTRLKNNGECYDSVSEKIAYELARALGYDCAEVELARDRYGNLGIFNKYFTNLNEGIAHQDYGMKFGITKDNCKTEYTLEKIRSNLDKIDKKLYDEFVSLMFFDALIGMGDRHENNWGYLYPNSPDKISIRLSPFYDNSGSLFHNINEDRLEKMANNREMWNSYVARSKSHIFDNHQHKMKHFEILKKLGAECPAVAIKENERIKQLPDKKIATIVKKVPDELISSLRKTLIIKYLVERKERICEIFG